MSGMGLAVVPAAQPRDLLRAIFAGADGDGSI